MIELAEPAARLAAAMLVGAVIGAHLDLFGKPTGVRLHALVAGGSALFVMLASESQLGLSDPATPGRIIQGIVGGIGFLGAGVILHSQKGEVVRNLTTAATLWMTAALGTACGLGAWRLAVLTSALVLLILTVGLKIDRKLYRETRSKDIDLGPPHDA